MADAFLEYLHIYQQVEEIYAILCSRGLWIVAVLQTVNSSSPS